MLGDTACDTPFLSALRDSTVYFRRAYATECWTLPSHMSMFTGLLPSEHQAHFQTMAYTGSTPTLAERLRDHGYHSEIVTRNFIFDGTIPGVTRGFIQNTQILSPINHPTLYGLFLAAMKPRFRRHLRTTGFFHALHGEQREFLSRFARAMLPADRQALSYVVRRLGEHRRASRPYFGFANLYDVHAPYPPSETSIVRPITSLSSFIESLTMHRPLAKIGSHAYLRRGFRMSDHGRRLLLGRYRTAVELMDRKLGAFFDQLRSEGLLQNTMVVLTSDHGEAFGDHGLYLHDASAYDTHLHVPLWIHHPDRSPEIVDDVVSMKDLCALICEITLGNGTKDTLLDAAYRERNRIVAAEHFFYPRVENADPRYRQNLAAVICGDRKLIVGRDAAVEFNLRRDVGEESPGGTSVADFLARCAADGVKPKTLETTRERLQRWSA